MPGVQDKGTEGRGGGLQGRRQGRSKGDSWRRERKRRKSEDVRDATLTGQCLTGFVAPVPLTGLCTRAYVCRNKAFSMCFSAFCLHAILGH